MTETAADAPVADAIDTTPARRPRALVPLVCAALLVGIGLSATCALLWRSSVRSEQRQTFDSSAINVTSTLSTLLRGDDDFVATLRGVLTMEPQLTPTSFNTWYSTLDGSQRQVGGVGSAVIANVAPNELAAFVQRRNADPAFRSLLGRSLLPIHNDGATAYCLLAAGGRLVPLNGLSTRLVQENWCSPTSGVGLMEAALLQDAAASDQLVVFEIDTSYLHTTFFETPFYRRGARLQTPNQRLAAVKGWLVSTFNMQAVVSAALGRNRGLSVGLYHYNPAFASELIATSGSAGRRPAFSRTADLDLDGSWQVVVRGAPAGTGLGADTQAVMVLLCGAIVTILLVGLVVVLVRSRERALKLVDQRTSQLRHQALHDALTGLPNRRALVRDLDLALKEAAAGRDTILALFDLDGFKEYNDTFGHPAGDALLARLGDRLSSTLEGIGRAYRMGGDEFCVLAAIGEHGAHAIAARATSALCESGEAFTIGCSYGITSLPGDASSAAEALRIADDRMYEHKGSRVSAGRQSTAVLITAATERSPELGLHLSEVATLATMTAQHLGIGEHEVKRITLAAELHDIGTVAIPDSILNRPGPLNDEEWAFMRRHTIIGERIIAAAPSLAPAAPLVRSSHERPDGTGYPDGLRGDEIPLGAAILAACEAFDAMTSERPYSGAVPVADALAELRRCAGTQFHPGVVEALCELIERPDGAACRPPAAPRAAGRPTVA